MHRTECAYSIHIYLECLKKCIIHNTPVECISFSTKNVINVIILMYKIELKMQFFFADGKTSILFDNYCTNWQLYKTVTICAYFNPTFC